MPHLRRALALVASVALATLALAACVSTPQPVEELDLEPLYRFSGNVEGEPIEGSITFTADGGYTLQSSHGICERQERQLDRPLARQAATGSIRLHCENLSLHLPVVDGKLQGRRAAARLSHTERRERRGRCVQVDEDTGICLGWDWKMETYQISREGSIELIVP